MTDEEIKKNVSFFRAQLAEFARQSRAAHDLVEHASAQAKNLDENCKTLQRVIQMYEGWIGSTDK